MRRYGARTGVSLVTARLLGGCLLAGCLLAGCAPGTTDSGPAAEDPGEEITRPLVDGPADEGGAAVAEVAVELPGLPVGGNDVVFSDESPAQCVEVNWTAATLGPGTWVRIQDIAVPEQFTVLSDPCSPTPCLGGFEFSSETTGCQVGVLWNGAPPPPLEDSQLVVTRARLACVDQDACALALGLIDAVGVATIGLLAEEGG